MTIDWKVISGPGVVDIADRSSLQTTAGFSAVGTYWLGLSAHDGELEGTSRLQIVVNEASMPAETDAFNQDPDAEGLVVMPAKNYSEKMDRGSSAWIPITQSGTQSMQASPDIGIRIATGYAASSPYLRFNVKLQKTGTHYVWVGGCVQQGQQPSRRTGRPGGLQRRKHDRAPQPAVALVRCIVLGGSRARLDVGTTGLHTVEVYTREDGFRLERILLTTSSSIPSESVFSEGDTGEPAESACGDGIDNDRDGLIDCDDSDCADARDVVTRISFCGPHLTAGATGCCTATMPSGVRPSRRMPRGVMRHRGGTVAAGCALPSAVWILNPGLGFRVGGRPTSLFRQPARRVYPSDIGWFMPVLLNRMSAGRYWLRWTAPWSATGRMPT